MRVRDKLQSCKAIERLGGSLQQVDIPDEGSPENSTVVKFCTYQTLNRIFISCIAVCVPKRQEEAREG